MKGAVKTAPFLRSFFCIIGFFVSGGYLSCRNKKDTKEAEPRGYRTGMESNEKRSTVQVLSAGIPRNSLFILYNAKNALFFKERYVRI